MRIRDITATTLRFEYPPGSQFDFAGGRCNARLTTLIRVDTDEGLSGIGSVYSHPYSDMMFGASYYTPAGAYQS
jgi:L-alanine-DL-glutamate epimerase-like enolase superfamily enzyme